MKIVSILENQKIEKRIAITPDISKKYIALGFQVAIVEKYGEHLGFKDSDYKKLGVEIFTNENAIPYLLKKPTCSKFYTIYTSSPKNLQKKMI